MLPTNPRAGRSKSATRQPPSQTRSAGIPRENSSWNTSGDNGRREERGRMPHTSDERSLRPQRSMASVRRPRAPEQSAPPPAMPRGGLNRAPSSYSKAAPRTSRSRPPSSRDSDSSASSVTSSSSSTSFLDRMRQRYPEPSSSQSSFEIERESFDSDKAAYTRDKTKIVGQSDPDPEPVATDISSYGQAFWNRVATAATSWSWSGTNASSIVAGFSDSKDSEITRVLKAYHISKAQERSDLPAWLFSEEERRVDKPTRRSEGDGISRTYDDQPARVRGRGLRDIYDSAAAETSPSSAPITRSRDAGRIQTYGSDTSGDAFSSSTATNRLRAMRDAKRQAAIGATSAGRVADSGSGDGFPDGDKASMEFGKRGNGGAYGDEQRDMGRSLGRGGSYMSEPERRVARPRVGLPTHPRGR